MNEGMQTSDALKRLLVLRPRHKWFCSPDCESEDEWHGPYGTIEAAVLACALKYGSEFPFHIRQGYRMTKREREGKGVEYSCEVGEGEMIEVRLPR